MDVLPALDGDRVRVLEAAAPFTHSTPLALKSPATPVVGWSTIPSFHSFALAKSSSGRHVHADLGEGLLSLLEREERGLHPCLGRDAPDAETGASEAVFLLVQTVFAFAELSSLMAAVLPPGPPPRTATSKSMVWPFPFGSVPNRSYPRRACRHSQNGRAALGRLAVTRG